MPQLCGELAILNLYTLHTLFEIYVKNVKYRETIMKVSEVIYIKGKVIQLKGYCITSAGKQTERHTSNYIHIFSLEYGLQATRHDYHRKTFRLEK